VIVDLAAERGGNCEVTAASQIVVEHGVTVIGQINLAAAVPYHASQMYARNISAFLMHLFANARKEPDLDDEIARDTLVTQAGEIVNARVREFYSLPARVAPK
jgi:NAD(P) transhydrogenase subunit alpha